MPNLVYRGPSVARNIRPVRGGGHLQQILVSISTLTEISLTYTDQEYQSLTFHCAALTRTLLGRDRQAKEEAQNQNLCQQNQWVNTESLDFSTCGQFHWQLDFGS